VGPNVVECHSALNAFALRGGETVERAEAPEWQLHFQQSTFQPAELVRIDGLRTVQRRLEHTAVALVPVPRAGGGRGVAIGKLGSW
jgi:hypothetical protein